MSTSEFKEELEIEVKAGQTLVLEIVAQKQTSVPGEESPPPDDPENPDKSSVDTGSLEFLVYDENDNLLTGKGPEFTIKGDQDLYNVNIQDGTGKSEALGPGEYEIAIKEFEKTSDEHSLVYSFSWLDNYEYNWNRNFYFQFDKPEPGADPKQHKNTLTTANAGSILNTDKNTLEDLTAFYDEVLSYQDSIYKLDKYVIKQVSFVGKASREGNTEYNLDLGYRRANLIREWIEDRYEHSGIEIVLNPSESLGELQADQQQTDPNDRRVETNVKPLDKEEASKGLFLVKIYIKEKRDGDLVRSPGTIVLTVDGQAFLWIGHIENQLTDANGVTHQGIFGKEISENREEEMVKAVKYSTFILNIMLDRLEKVKEAFKYTDLDDTVKTDTIQNLDTLTGFIQEAKDKKLEQLEKENENNDSELGGDETVFEIGVTYEVTGEMDAHEDYTKPDVQYADDGTEYRGISINAVDHVQPGDLIKITELTYKVTNGYETKKPYQVVKAQIQQKSGQTVAATTEYYFWVIYEGVEKIKSVEQDNTN